MSIRVQKNKEKPLNSHRQGRSLDNEMIILEIVSEPHSYKRHEIPKESNGIVTQMDVHEHFCFKQAFYNIFVHILSKYTLSVGSKSYKKKTCGF